MPWVTVVRFGGILSEGGGIELPDIFSNNDSRPGG